MRGRGQAAAAAILLAIIAGSIVLFLLVMDPEEREVLLGDETLSSGTGSTSTSTDYLLQEYPGRIEDLQQSEIEHKLPSMHLVVLDQGVILDERISLSTKHSDATTQLKIMMNFLSYCDGQSSLLDISEKINQPFEVSYDLMKKLTNAKLVTI